MLVDPSVWIDFFKGHDSKESARLADAIADGEPVVLPGLVLTEILLGFRQESEASRIAVLLEAFDEMPEPVRGDYVEAARIYRLCRTQGFTIRSTIDCLIATMCLREQVPLLSKDRDFAMIAECVPLQLLECR